MGIKQRNRDDILVNLSVPGTQSAAVNKQTFVVPFACRLTHIYALLGTAGTTGSQIVDVNKNGTTIFTGATKLTFPSTVAAATYDTFSTDPPVFVKGDRITVDVDSIHTTAAVNLNLLLVLTRSRRMAPVKVVTNATE